MIGAKHTCLILYPIYIHLMFMAALEDEIYTTKSYMEEILKSKIFSPKASFFPLFRPILHKTLKNSTVVIYEWIWKIPKVCVRMSKNLTKSINTPFWERSSKVFFGWWKFLQNRVYLGALKTTWMMPRVNVFSISPSIKVKTCPSSNQSRLYA